MVYTELSHRWSRVTCKTIRISQSYKGINDEMRSEPGSSNSKPSVVANMPSLLFGCNRGRNTKKKRKIRKNLEQRTISMF